MKIKPIIDHTPDSGRVSTLEEEMCHRLLDLLTKGGKGYSLTNRDVAACQLIWSLLVLFCLAYSKGDDLIYMHDWQIIAMMISQ